MGKRIDLIGHKFGVLTVVSMAESVKSKHGTVGFWNVVCDCGLTRKIRVQTLREHTHKSCGKGCSLRWDSEIPIEVSCQQCGSNYQIKYASSKKSSVRLCKKCISKNGSDAVKGRKAPNRLPDGEAAFNSLYGAYKRNAIKFRKVSFELTKDQFRDITKQNCHYCGRGPNTIRDPEAMKSKGKNSGAYVYNGVDRVDSSKGYELDNVVPCCSTCNYMKSDLSVDEFYKHLLKIISFSGKRQEVF